MALVTCLRALGEVHHGADDVGSHQHGCAAAEQARPDAGHGGQEHLQHVACVKDVGDGLIIEPLSVRLSVCLSLSLSLSLSLTHTHTHTHTSDLTWQSGTHKGPD